MALRQGAQQLAHTENPRIDPLMANWVIHNNTMIFALTGDTDALGLPGMVPQWPYANDFVSNMIIYVDLRQVPQDIALVHRLRSMIFQVATRRSLLLNLVDFAESFGANPRSVMKDLGEIDDLVASAKPFYLQLEFRKALQIYEEAENRLAQLEAKAMELKDQALLWVYIIEYLTVVGTSIIAGSIVWSLMVSKRAYRAVGATRFKAR